MKVLMKLNRQPFIAIKKRGPQKQDIGSSIKIQGVSEKKYLSESSGLQILMTILVHCGP